MQYVGIDIGGTTIKAGLVDGHGLVTETRRAVTPTADLQSLVSTLTGIVADLRTKSEVRGVGIGIPGLRSARTRTMQTSPHIPALRDVNLEDLLTDSSGLPVVTENDANAGAYGEWACGAGRGLQHMVYLTLGTGLGCGIVLSGQMFRGVSGYAGEFGHTIVQPEGRPCACGSRGCLETVVSGTGMVQTARERLAKDPSSSLHAFAPDALTAQQVYDAAIQGDATAGAVFHETGVYLGIGCVNIINLLNPEMIVISGGVMASGDLLLRPAIAEISRRAFAPSAKDCAIVPSRLWPDAGIVGAAMLAAHSFSPEMSNSRSKAV